MLSVRQVLGYKEDWKTDQVLCSAHCVAIALCVQRTLSCAGVDGRLREGHWRRVQGRAGCCLGKVLPVLTHVFSVALVVLSDALWRGDWTRFRPN